MFENIKLPFSISELISVTLDLISMIGPFLLLYIAIVFVFPFIRLFYQALEWNSSEANSFNASKGLKRGDTRYISKADVVTSSFSRAVQNRKNRN